MSEKNIFTEEYNGPEIRGDGDYFEDLAKKQEALSDKISEAIQDSYENQDDETKLKKADELMKQDKIVTKQIKEQLKFEQELRDIENQDPNFG